jgi:glycosyltransferase involved in cell wall biosynthesis
MARISVFCGDLSRGPLYTAWMFTGAMRMRHEVTLTGPRPEQLWPPAQGEIEPSHYLSGSLPLSSRVRREARAAASGAQLVYAFKAHPASVGIGEWLRHALDVPLAVHLDDWDGGYFSEVSPARRAWYALRNVGRIDNELYYRVCERLAKRADLLTVSTSALQRRFGGTVVRQGVDERRFRPGIVSRQEARRRLGFDPDEPLVVFTGTATVHKGIADLIEAFRALPADLRGRLVVAGGAADAQTGAMIAGHRDVEFTSTFPFADTALYVAAADVVCAPQRPTAYAQHQLPAKILHWMTLGGCILTTDVGDAQELLGGAVPAGVVVPPLDAQALRDALAALLEDPARRAELGDEAATRAKQRYGWTAMSAQLDELVRGLGIR